MQGTIAIYFVHYNNHPGGVCTMADPDFIHNNCVLPRYHKKK